MILTLFYSFTLGGYFVISDIKAVDGQLVFYVSRVLFGFYMNGAPQADAQTRRRAYTRTAACHCHMSLAGSASFQARVTNPTPWLRALLYITLRWGRGDLLHADPVLARGGARGLPRPVLHGGDREVSESRLGDRGAY